MKALQENLAPLIIVGVVALIAGLVIGGYNRETTAIDKRNAKERRAAKAAQVDAAMAQPLRERLYETTQGRLLVLAVPIKRGRSEIDEVPCFVWLGLDGAADIACSDSVDARMYVN